MDNSSYPFISPPSYSLFRRTILGVLRHAPLLAAGTVSCLLVATATLVAFHAHHTAPTTSPSTKQLAVQQTTPGPVRPTTTTGTTSTGTSKPTASSPTPKPPASTGGSTSSSHNQGSGSGTTGSGTTGGGPSPQTTWAACSQNAASGGPSTFTPMSDAAAAALVTHQPEIRPDNARPFSIAGVNHAPTNTYVPTDAQINTFRNTTNQYGQTAVQANPYMAYVDGRDGLANPSTDDLIQWGAHKWGIPEDWLRAEYSVESYWNMFALGDQTTETASDYVQYPVQSQVPNSTDAFESLGITQERWNPSSSNGSEPLRWESTAFNIDFQLAVVRFYYDNPSGMRMTWGDSSYVPCQQWNSIGGWFNPYPWNNSGQASYVSKVQSYLSQNYWAQSSFINYTVSIPAAVTMQ